MAKDSVRDFNFPFKAPKRKGRYDYVVDTKAKGKVRIGKNNWSKWAIYDTKEFADDVAREWKKSGSLVRVRKVLAR